MATIAFHANALTLRGTEVALFDYAHFAEELLLHRSVITIPKRGEHNPLVVQKFSNRFPVFFYNDREELERILKEQHADLLYCIKYGTNDGLISNVTKTAVHAVFDMSEAHGNIYAGVSQYLANKYRQPLFVPHIVHLPAVETNLRERLGIPGDTIVFGRHGGNDSFDIDFVKRTVVEVAESNSRVRFLFLGTDPFCNHPRVTFLPAAADPRAKVEFINTCDAMLHARNDGETFGLACAEFSIRNKPVITFTGGRNRSHLEILGNKALLYSAESDLKNILNTFRPRPEWDWDAYTSRFNPFVVMDKFAEVFLTPLGISSTGARKSPPLTLSAQDEKKFWVFSNDNLSRNLLRGEKWEPHLTTFFKRFLRSGDCAVDVGAAFGFHTATMADAVEKSGRVIAFEPQTPVFQALVKNCRENSAWNVEPHHAVLSENDGEIFLNPIDYGSDGINLGDAHISQNAERGERVKSLRLDSVARDLPIRLMKIDVQGAERAVILGALNTIKKERPYLVVEFEDHCLNRFGYSSRELFELLHTLRYAIFYLEYTYPSDHLCVPLEQLAQFRKNFADVIKPHTETNSLNHNRELGVVEKIQLL